MQLRERRRQYDKYGLEFVQLARDYSDWLSRTQQAEYNIKQLADGFEYTP